MPGQDTLALWRARMTANAPQITQSDGSVALTFAQALLSSIDDSSALITNAQANMFVQSAAGAALDALAANYGVTRDPGSAASVLLTFARSNTTDLSTTLTVPAATAAATVGDGSTVIAQGYTIGPAASISAGTPNTDSNQVETVTITGTPTGGTFTLTHAGQTTAAIAFNATAAAVQSALAALSNVGTNPWTSGAQVACAGGPLPGTAVTVTWQGTLGGTVFPVLTPLASFTGGTSPAVGVALTTASVPTVAATATVNGAAGNVNAGTITTLPASPLAVTVTNKSAATGGRDAWTDQQLRNAVLARILPQYGAAALQAAILAASTSPAVYDAYVLDPQTGSGALTYYWALADGTTPGLSGGVVTAGTAAATVDAALRAVLPPNEVPTASAFTLVTLGQINITYSVATSIQSSQIEPLIVQAALDYINGSTTSSPQQPGVQHGAVPNTTGMQRVVDLETGGVLAFFEITGTTPSIGSASNTTLYRASTNCNFILARL